MVLLSMDKLGYYYAQRGSEPLLETVHLHLLCRPHRITETLILVWQGDAIMRENMLQNSSISHCQPRSKQLPDGEPAPAVTDPMYAMPAGSVSVKLLAAGDTIVPTLVLKGGSRVQQVSTAQWAGPTLCPLAA